MHAPDPGYGNARLVLDVELTDGTAERRVLGAHRSGWPSGPADPDLERLWEDYRLRMHFVDRVGHAGQERELEAFLRWYCRRNEDVRRVTLKKVVRASPTDERDVATRSVLSEEILLEDWSPES